MAAPALSFTVPEIRPKMVCACTLTELQAIKQSSDTSSPRTTSVPRCFDDDLVALNMSMDLQSRIRDLKTTVPATNRGVVPGNSPLSFLAPEQGNWENSENSFETRFELDQSRSDAASSIRILSRLSSRKIDFLRCAHEICRIIVTVTKAFGITASFLPRIASHFAYRSPHHELRVEKC
jgi:hypothetical protein